MTEEMEDCQGPHLLLVQIKHHVRERELRKTAHRSSFHRRGKGHRDGPRMDLEEVQATWATIGYGFNSAKGASNSYQ
jgi:hypothetical protein